MQALIILSVTSITFILITLLPGLRGWRTAITSRGNASVFIILPLIMPFLGSTEAAQVGSLLSDIPRIVRAILVSGLFAVSTFSIMSHMESWRLAGKGARWMIYFFLLCIVSATWSINPLISAWKGFESLALSLSVVSLAHFLNNEKDIKWLLNLTSACLLFLVLTVIIGLIFYPSEAIKNIDSMNTKNYFAVRGVVPIMNPATIGSLAALLFISTFSSTLVSKTHRNIKNNHGVWVVAVLAITDMLLGHSRTPIFACIIAIIGILYFSNKTKQMVTAGLVGALILTISSGADLILSYIYRGQTVENFTALTGRLSFWERDIYGLIADSPIIGQGYYAGFRESLNVGSIDNAFLAVILGVGFLGFIVFIMPIIHGSFSIIQSRPRRKKITERDGYWLIIFGFFWVLLIRSLTGTSFEVMHPLLIIYMILQLSITGIIRVDKIKIKNNDSDRSNDETIKDREKQRILKKSNTQVLHTINKNRHN